MYTRNNYLGKGNRPPDAAINPHAWAKGTRRRAPACHPVPSRAQPVWPLPLPAATWRPRKARGIAPRFDRLLGSRHHRGAATRFSRKPAHSGCCRTQRSQNPPCLRGKLRRPTHPKTAVLHSFGDYCRGDGPRAGNGTRILFKKQWGWHRPSIPARAWPGRSTRSSPASRPD